MLFKCPQCESKTRIASSRAISKETRESYWQCLNLNCGVGFVTYTSVSHMIKPTGGKPDPTIQPELCKVEDIRMFGTM